MAGIREVILESLKDTLTADCQTAIPPSNKTRVDTIESGKMVDDPTIGLGNHIRILYGDPRTRPMRWRDEAARMTGAATIYRYGGGVEAAEIGGGEYWWRRLMIQVISNYSGLGYSQEVAQEYANTVIQRVRKSLRDNLITGEDDFGEQVADGAYSKVRWEEAFETGGGVSWIWRTFIGVEVQTYVG